MEKLIFMAVGGLGSVGALTFGLIVLNNKLNEVKNDLNRGLAKKADVTVCQKQHENDGRLQDKLEKMNVLISEMSQTIIRIETRINYFLKEQ